MQVFTRSNSTRTELQHADGWSDESDINTKLKWKVQEWIFYSLKRGNVADVMLHVYVNLTWSLTELEIQLLKGELLLIITQQQYVTTYTLHFLGGMVDTWLVR